MALGAADSRGGPCRDPYQHGAASNSPACDIVKLLTDLYRLAPDLAERFVKWQIEAEHITPDRLEPGAGALFEPMQDRWAVSGGWRNEPGRATRLLLKRLRLGLQPGRIPAR
jgi:hypothetical protein